MEWSYLRGSLRVILALGAIAHKAACQLLGLSSQAAFSHGARYESATGISLLSSYHPSQQNTFTRRLTWEMWQEVFIQAREAAFAPMG
jgi:uracil-DNA glycosylase